MSAKTVLRALIVTEWVFQIAAVIVESALEATLPAPLRTYLEQEADSSSFLSPVGEGIVGVVLLIIWIVATSIGLFLLARWGRLLYVASTLIFLLSTPLW